MPNALKFYFIMVVGLILIVPAAGYGQRDNPREGIKLDQEIVEMLNTPALKRVPSQVKIFKECKDENAGLFFFVTPIMAYLESDSFGNAGTRFFDAEQFDRAIRAKLEKEGTPLSMFCAHILAEFEKVKLGEYSYGNLLDHILECHKVCGPTLTAIASVYMYNSAKAFEGLILFNFDNAVLYGQLEGDRSHGFIGIDNESQLEKVYQKWLDSGRTLKIGLDGRASLPGGALYNDELSRKRLTAVEQWFTDTKDVPVSMVDRKWIGNYGPHIDENVAELYKIQSFYELYKNNEQAEKQYFDGRDVYHGLNQSVAIFLYEDVNIHIDVGPSP